MDVKKQTCEFQGCDQPVYNVKKGWHWCVAHHDELDQLLHYTDPFDMQKLDDFWKRADGTV